MSTAHDDLAAFQQFALQKVNVGEPDWTQPANRS